MHFRTHATPNPNSLKIERADGGPIIADGMRSYTAPDEAAGDPLGEALFALDGVAGVFMLPAFLTITRAPGVEWRALVPAVERVLQARLEGEG